MARIAFMGLVRGLGRIVFGKLLPRRPYRVIRGPLKGAKFILGSMSGEGGGATAYFGLMEPEQAERMSREISEGDVFYDIGANVGFYSILASRRVGSSGLVASFEPLGRNLAFLEEHRKLNLADNVQILPFAVSDVAGVARFNEGPDPAMGSLAPEGNEGLSVEIITLDQAVKAIGRPPNVIKIDVEGAEAAVIAGGEHTLRSMTPKIFLSTHSPQLRDDCIRKLTSFGYACEPLGDGRSDEFYCESRGRK